jgi:AcrR family transcriptional regulator
MKKGETTRQRIIEAAALLLNKKGISGTTISDMMGATKLAKGGIYRQFDSKEEIVLEAFSFLSGRLAKTINDTLNSKDEAKDKLFAVLDLYHDRLALIDNGGCPLLNFGVESDDTDPDLRDRVSQAIQAIQEKFAQTVSGGIASGEFKPGINAASFGIRLFNTLEGTILASRVFNSKAQMKLVTDSFRNEIATFLI